MTTVADLVILAGFATGMTLISSVSVKWAAFTDTALRAGVVEFLLLMMAGMFVGVLVYFALGGTSGVVAGLWVATATMSASVLLVFIGFFRDLRARGTTGGGSISRAHREGFVALVVTLVVLNEFLMGWSFSLLSGQLAPGLGPRIGDALHVLALAITSPWFVFPMALEMVVTLRWLRSSLPRVLGPFLFLQPAIMICSPPTLPGVVWVVTTAVGASGLMALAVTFFLVDLLRVESFPRAIAEYLAGLLASLGLMAAGLFFWIELANPGVFALSVLGQMVVFLYAVTDPKRFGSSARAVANSADRGPLTESTDRA